MPQAAAPDGGTASPLRRHATICRTRAGSSAIPWCRPICLLTFRRSELHSAIVKKQKRQAENNMKILLSPPRDIVAGHGRGSGSRGRIERNDRGRLAEARRSSPRRTTRATQGGSQARALDADTVNPVSQHHL